MITTGSRLGPYEIIGPLGEGGMGEVYRARDTRLGRDVALKILPERFARDREALARFRREACSASGLNHAHIVTIHDVGSERQADGSEIHYFTMEFVEGGTLRERIGRDPLKKLLGYMMQVADGLAKAHGAGILHRDLKPENIMITTDGYAKIVDFGLAKSDRDRLGEVDSEAATQFPKTSPGFVVGTVSYMSPEQVEGTELDARSDIFSMGCILYEIATGKRPFEAGSKFQTMQAIVHSEPPRIAESNPTAPSELQRIIDRCVAKDRDARYQSVKEVAIELRSLLRLLDSSGTVQQAKVQRRFPQARVLGIAVAIAVVIAALIAGWRVYVGRTAAGIESIAVLPLVNGSGDPSMEYLSDGITESLIDNLSQIPKLRVMSPATTFTYKGRQVDPREVGRTLRVASVLQGKVMRFGETLRIKVDLIDAAQGTEIWGEEYDRKRSDVLATQAEISREIARQLRLRLSGEEQKRLAQSSTGSPEAYEHYLKGRYEVEKYTLEGIRTGIAHFQQAIDLDPNYALAYSGLAYAYWTGDDFFFAPRDSMAKAREAAAKALQLDDSLPEAHLDLGIVGLGYDYDWPAAEREFRRAIEIRPTYATAHVYYGWYLVSVGRVEEAIRESRRAVELDPLSTETGSIAGQNYWCAHRYDLAIPQLQKTADMDPNYGFNHFLLGLAYEGKGDYARAVSEMEKARALEKSSPWILSVLANGYAVAGRKQEAEHALSELKDWSRRGYVPAFSFAEAYVGLGEKEKALDALEQAYADHCVGISFLKADPRFDSLRSEPRFKELLRRVGLTS